MRLAAIPNIVGVKEASGNIVRCPRSSARSPPDFIVLCGDDPLTVPVMAIGGRGVISVASNEAPADMVQMVEAVRARRFRRARASSTTGCMPLMQVNFVEANPLP